ncbi:protein containing Peptidase C14, caspase catalytic domain [Sulfurimonas gotlandica GD1]|uniref:Protein containing Peptidase C14, caspase catalytic domain n=2 Tax=Sulfurimonas TaxID=202746 RepID=B6BHC4_SULGG|nr:caspase domain protein [Sulfurimonas gotlandica GD1]EHP29918.1 protein containing Peptidase C14, caspase catalytic domain [Sulfurimonas gotlandica GD1]
MEDVTKAIQAGAFQKGWTTRVVKPGEIEAEIVIKNYMAKVKINYDTTNYSISYMDSKNLKYDGTKVHRTYNSWVANLKKNIDARLALDNSNAQIGTPLAVNGNHKAKNGSSSGYPYTFKKSVKEKEDSFALVIGISRYQQNTPVEYADTSALAFAELANKTFGIPKQNIITLVNDEATSGQLKAKIELLKELADKRGNIYIYFAGHGVPGKDGSTYMLPYDMTADGIHLEPSLKLDNIYAKLSTLNVKNVFVFMDSCFSGKDDKGGLLYRGVAPVLKSKKTVIDADNITIITAGQSTDFANDYRDKGQRMFSYYLIKELSDGETNLNKIYPEIKSSVKRSSLMKGIGYKQVPQIYGNKSVLLY